MAIIKQCSSCNENFMTSAASFACLCSKCDGTEAILEAEKQRWQSLTLEQRVDELKKRVEAIEHNTSHVHLLRPLG